jgi:hypothetical protein
MIIGQTSAVTYQIVGHFKTSMLLLLGFFLFNNPFQVANVLGIITAWVGMIIYTELKRRESNSAVLSKAIELSNPVVHMKKEISVEYVHDDDDFDDDLVDK